MMTANSDLPPRSRRIPLGPLVLGVLLGVVAAFVGLVAFTVFSSDRLPALSPQRLEQAEQRWRDHGPKSYRMDIRTGGRAPSQLHVEVRGGEVASVLQNGHPLDQPRTMDPWSVDALLEFMSDELAAAADPVKTAQKFGSPAGATVLQAAAFDEKYGYPRRYRRSVLGTPMDIDWEITKFEPVD
jgi:hypothetical protein